MFNLRELLVVLAAVIGSGSMVGILAWMYHRVRLLESSRGAQGDTTEILEAIADLRHEVNRTQDDVAELIERVDFAERLLPRGPAAEDKP